MYLVFDVESLRKQGPAASRKGFLRAQTSTTSRVLDPRREGQRNGSERGNDATVTRCQGHTGALLPRRSECQQSTSRRRKQRVSRLTQFISELAAVMGIVVPVDIYVGTCIIT